MITMFSLVWEGLLDVFVFVSAACWRHPKPEELIRPLRSSIMSVIERPKVTDCK